MHSKGNYKQGKKTALRMGENNRKRNNWQRFNFQNIQGAHTTQYQQNEQPNQRVGKRPKQTFLQRRHTMANTWKDAQCLSSLEQCKSKLQWDTTSHQSEWPSSKCLQIINTGKSVGKKGTFLHCWWECKLLWSLWRIAWCFLKKIWSEIPYNTAVLLLACTQRKSYFKNTHTLQCSL